MSHPASNHSYLTKRDAKMYLADVCSLMIEGRNAMLDAYHRLNEIDLYDYAGFIDDAVELLREEWRSTIRVEDGKVVFRFTENIRTDEGNITVFSKDQILFRVLKSIDNFGKEFGLDLGLCTQMRKTASYKTFHWQNAAYNLYIQNKQKTETSNDNA